MRLALETTVERADVERRLLDAGLALVAVLPKTDAHPAQLVFLSSDHRTVVHWVVDDRSGGTFLAFSGPDAARAREAAKALPHVDEIEKEGA